MNIVRSNKYLSLVFQFVARVRSYIWQYKFNSIFPAVAPMFLDSSISSSRSVVIQSMQVRLVVPAVLPGVLYNFTSTSSIRFFLQLHPSSRSLPEVLPKFVSTSSIRFFPQLHPSSRSLAVHVRFDISRNYTQVHR